MLVWKKWSIVICVYCAYSLVQVIVSILPVWVLYQLFYILLLTWYCWIDLYDDIKDNIIDPLIRSIYDDHKYNQEQFVLFYNLKHFIFHILFYFTQYMKYFDFFFLNFKNHSTLFFFFYIHENWWNWIKICLLLHEKPFKMYITLI